MRAAHRPRGLYARGAPSARSITPCGDNKRYQNGGSKLSYSCNVFYNGLDGLAICSNSLAAEIEKINGCQAKFLDTFRNTLYNPLVDWGWLPWRREIL